MEKPGKKRGSRGKGPRAKEKKAMLFEKVVRAPSGRSWVEFAGGGGAAVVSDVLGY